MTAEHRGDRVTVLTGGSTDTEQCGCYVSYRVMPTLRTGQTPSSLDIVYINALQQMLTTLGRRPDIPTTNVYDLRTADEVRRLQFDAGLPTTGATDPETWKSLQNRACELY
jgi:murein L,D-transpeptidase YcbB/YkuD